MQAHFPLDSFDTFSYFLFFMATAPFHTDHQKGEAKEGTRNTAALEAVGPTTPQFSEGLSLLRKDTWMGDRQAHLIPAESGKKKTIVPGKEKKKKRNKSLNCYYCGNFTTKEKNTKHIISLQISMFLLDPVLPGILSMTNVNAIKPC